MKHIRITPEVYNRLQKDKKEFTKLIGYQFTYDDIFKEYFKILDMIKNDAHNKNTKRKTKN